MKCCILWRFAYIIIFLCKIFLCILCLGHNLEVCKEYFRLLDSNVELAKFSKLLFVVDAGNGKDFCEKNLEDIYLNDWKIYYVRFFCWQNWKIKTLIRFHLYSQYYCEQNERKDPIFLCSAVLSFCRLILLVFTQKVRCVLSELHVQGKPMFSLASVQKMLFSENRNANFFYYNLVCKT